METRARLSKATSRSTDMSIAGRTSIQILVHIGGGMGRVALIDGVLEEMLNYCFAWERLEDPEY
jgi:hypothetical protein